MDILWPLVCFAGTFLFTLGLAGPLTWAERRQSAMIQDRIGPNRAYIPLQSGKQLRVLGLLHPIADVIKLITKEDVINQRVDRVLFNIAPLIALFPALVTFAVIPFGPDVEVDGVMRQLQLARIDAGILYVFAMSSLAVFGVSLAGYASASPWALLGGIRASAQMISYEVTMGLAILGVVMTYGSLEPYAIVVGQGEYLFGILPKWGIFVQPLAFILFFTAAIAENKRTPFDLVEGESEIIGYFVEYSGMKFGMFFMAEYVEILVVGGLITTLFLGGWQVPFLSASGFQIPVMMSSAVALPKVLVVLLQVGSFALKLLFMAFLQLQIRWSLPRFRYDQVMHLGWRVLLPLSLLNILFTAVAKLGGLY
ncbi:MAG: NADH-quinone oxidoreductase subunit H [Deltaproteobacteria bacterium]|nr:NADH-quinone oxidoreductase subunit H [Deltaproteobacteria bacterium]